MANRLSASRNHLEISFEDVDFNNVGDSFGMPPKKRTLWRVLRSSPVAVTFALCAFLNVIILGILLITRVPEPDCNCIEGDMQGFTSPAPIQTEEPPSEYASPPPPPKPEPLKFMVIGDWGRNGSAAINHLEGGDLQIECANAMAAVAADFNPQFVVSTGDNFYPGGLRSADDPQFNDAFTSVYHHESLQVPWYAVLGNHDHNMHINYTALDNGTNCIANSFEECDDDCCYSSLWESDVRLNELDPRWHLQRSYDLVHGDVHFFFLDTSPAVRDYFNLTLIYSDDYHPEGSIPWFELPGAASSNSWESQLRELEARLYRSSAPWKVMVGHHPVYGNCASHGDTQELVDTLQPLLEKYNVQLYLNGHNHVLEHLHVPDKVTHYITSGAGSALNFDFIDRPEMTKFVLGDNGFVTIEIREADATMQFFSGNATMAGELLHEATIGLQG